MSTEESTKAISDFMENSINEGIETMKRVCKAAKEEGIEDTDIISQTIRGILSRPTFRPKKAYRVTGTFDSVDKYLAEVYDKEPKDEKENPTLKSIWQIGAHLEGFGYDLIRDNRAKFNELVSIVQQRVDSGSILQIVDANKVFYSINPKILKEEFRSSGELDCDHCTKGNVCDPKIQPGSKECIKFRGE